MYAFLNGLEQYLYSQRKVKWNIIFNLSNYLLNRVELFRFLFVEIDIVSID